MARMNAKAKFIPNCGAPLNREAIRQGKTWSAKHRKWLRPEQLGATVTLAPDGWWVYFGMPYHEGNALIQEMSVNYRNERRNT